MRPCFQWLAAAVAFALISSSIAAQAPASFSPLDMRVPVSPRALVASGQTHIAYEVRITNMAPRPVTLDLVEVRDRSSKPDAAPLLRLEGEALDGAVLRFGAQPDERDRRQLAAGQTSVLFVWLSINSDRVPSQLTHHVAVRLPAAAGTGTNAIAVDGLEVAVLPGVPRIIGPPLEGDHWLAANGPDNSAGHRRTFLSLTGEARIAQRFAIDWVRVHDDGRTFRGDPLMNASYRAFGANVLAVADGVVVDALDEIPENIPDLVARAVPMTPRTLVGNYVLLDIGNGAWAVYAHLQLGSVRVRQGERVRRGQVLGLVGNTGNSTEPHLHFHLSDRARAIDSEGIPYALDRFELEAAGMDVTRALETVGQNIQVDPARINEWFTRPSQTRRNEIPLMNALVAFPRR